MVKMRNNFNPSVAFIVVVVMTGSKSAVGTRVLEHKQNAVFSLVGSENFYVEMKKTIPFTYVDDGQLGQLRNDDYDNDNFIEYMLYGNLNKLPTQQIPTERDQSEDLSNKSMICSFIFDSLFFDARGEEAVNYDLTQTETMNDLRESKRDTYDDIYGDYPNADGQWLNPYKRRTVFVGGERFEEHTFRCLARRRDSKTGAADSYVDYFVSPIYQSKMPEDLIMNGRFVFTSNRNNELILIATAEERVGEINKNYIKDMHRYYYKYSINIQKLDETNNVLCALTLRDKMRLCDSVMNLPDFPDEVSFVPNEANVKAKCEEKTVLGKVEDRQGTNEKSVTMEITYDQWMVGCKGDGTKGNPLSSWYYISPGTSWNLVAVFRQSPSENVCTGLVGVFPIYWAQRGIADVPISSKIL